MRAHRRREGRADDGFTLIELLVVITILGILAAVVVFAVQGIGDKGLQASIATDAAVVRTAEESYCANHSTYGTVADLTATPGNFLATPPSYNSVVKLPSGPCGGTGFAVGSPQFVTTSGPPAFVAANNAVTFPFLMSSFSSAVGPIQFTFGASGAFKTALTTGTATATEPSPGTQVLFASADESNVNAVIPAGAAPGQGPSPVTGTNGTCNTATSTCPGIAADKVHYANGRLDVFSCAAGGATLPPATGAPVCTVRATGAPGAPPVTPADLVSDLQTVAGFKLVIADPNTSAAADHLPTTPVNASTSNAPYGVAAFEALTNGTGVGGGGLAVGNAGSSCTGVTAGTGSYCALVNGQQIIFGSNVTKTFGLVTAGSANAALIPRSFVSAPVGSPQDTDNYTSVPATAHDPIRQWAVVLNQGSAADQATALAFLVGPNSVTSSTGQAVLAAYGYDPLS